MLRPPSACAEAAPPSSSALSSPSRSCTRSSTPRSRLHASCSSNSASACLSTPRNCSRACASSRRPQAPPCTHASVASASAAEASATSRKRVSSCCQASPVRPRVHFRRHSRSTVRWPRRAWYLAKMRQKAASEPPTCAMAFRHASTRPSMSCTLLAVSPSPGCSRYLTTADSASSGMSFPCRRRIMWWMPCRTAEKFPSRTATCT
mmetsp:Transcript_46985/g.117619  ORF Transcript_46985/g.117619 Transcript_46985/m.117619 type:complete len:206 (-) Transcript_46985:370-987(-)